MELDAAGMVLYESLDGTDPVPSALVASARPSVIMRATVDESDVIAHFLHGAGLSADEILSDVTGMEDALANHLACFQAPNNDEESNLLSSILVLLPGLPSNVL